MHKIVWFIILLCVGCTGSGGAVVFAPTPLPPDLSPLPYTHPSGAFTLVVPRTWAVYTQHTTTLASAAFSPPESSEPLLTVSVAQPGADIDLDTFINRYQVELRPRLNRYTETGRQLVDDGSWRLDGLLESPGGLPQHLNTFIVQSGDLLGVAEITVPLDDPDAQAALESSLNTLQLNADNTLEDGRLAVFVSAAQNTLEITDITTWWAASGVFFVTGEVLNRGTQALSDVQVGVQLYDANGRIIVGAGDMVMGYSIPPGGFAPFSLRFGQGQPSEAVDYVFYVGAGIPLDSVPDTADLSWEQEYIFTDDRELVIEGTLTNNGSRPVARPMAVITVLDEADNVIAAGFSLITEDDLAPDDSIDFALRVLEIGGEPSDYILDIQAAP